MRPLSSTEARQYTHPLLTRTFIQRVEKILNSDIDDLLPDNPYLLPAASPTWAATFVEDALGDHLRQAEVTFIDDLLRALSIFVAERTCDGHSSDQPGVDLEFNKQGVHYLVSVQPGASRENPKTQNDRAEMLRQAITRLGHATQPVLGYLYGRASTTYVCNCLMVAGPNFWYLISEDPHLYTVIIETVSRETKFCRDTWAEQEARAHNRMLKQFLTRYCDKRGAYDWGKFVEHRSCDLDLPILLAEV